MSSQYIRITVPTKFSHRQASKSLKQRSTRSSNLPRPKDSKTTPKPSARSNKEGVQKCTVKKSTEYNKDISKKNAGQPKTVLVKAETLTAISNHWSDKTRPATAGVKPTSNGSTPKRVRPATAGGKANSAQVKPPVTGARATSARRKLPEDNLFKIFDQEGAAQEPTKIKRCQLWRIPRQITEMSRLKSNFFIKATATTTRVIGTDMYCPSCDLFFENITEYHEHLLHNNMKRKYQEKSKELKEERKQREETYQHIQNTQDSMTPYSIRRGLGQLNKMEDVSTVLHRIKQLGRERQKALVNKEKTRQNFNLMPECRRIYSKAESEGRIIKARRKRDEEAKALDDVNERIRELSRKKTSTSSDILENLAMNSRRISLVDRQSRRQSFRQSRVSMGMANAENKQTPMMTIVDVE